MRHVSGPSGWCDASWCGPDDGNRGRDGVRANPAPPPAYCRGGGAAQPRGPTERNWPAAGTLWTPNVSYNVYERNTSDNIVYKRKRWEGSSASFRICTDALFDTASTASRMAVFVFCFIAVHWIATLAFSDFIVISLAATKLSVSRCVIVQILFRKSYIFPTICSFYCNIYCKLAINI